MPVPKKPCITYTQFKAFACEQDFRTQKEYRDWFKNQEPNPKDKPSKPELYYGDQWEGWRVVLGTRIWATYDEFKSIVKAQRLRTVEDFVNWEKPDNIPSHPDRVYRDEWEGWPVVIGNPYNSKSRDFLSYEDARTIVRNQGFDNVEGFRKWTTRPSEIPAGPPSIYKDEWEGWPEFLGTGRIGNWDRKDYYKTYEEAKSLVQSLVLKSAKEYFSWHRDNRPVDMPSEPQEIYKEQWLGWPNFLGYKRRVWQRKAIIQFLTDLLQDAKHLTEVEVLSILYHEGVPLGPAHGDYDFLKEYLTLPKLINPLAIEQGIDKVASRMMKRLEEEEEGKTTPSAKLVSDTEDYQTDVAADEQQQTNCLERPPMTVADIEQAADAFENRIYNPDELLVEFFVSNRVNDLWKMYLKGEDLDKINDMIGRPENAGV